MEDWGGIFFPVSVLIPDIVTTRENKSQRLRLAQFFDIHFRHSRCSRNEFGV